MNQQPGLVILDARPADEYDNKSSKVYMNLGYMKGALNINNMNALDLVLSGKNKSTPFLIYGSNDKISAMICQAMAKKGYRNVYYLVGGFYHFVWTTANIEDCRTGRDFLVNHDGIY